MIGRRLLQSEHKSWNRRWRAPYGSQLRYAFKVLPLQAESFARLLGPFAFQPNSKTRTFEYPWAFHAVPVGKGSRVVDVGGALSGFPFTLSAAGCEVINVDPFYDYGSSTDYSRRNSFDPHERIARLNRAFDTSVELRRSTIADAGLDNASVDVVYCISTLEHLPPDAIQEVLAETARALRPGGHLVLTVDLFFDLQPFTDRETNRYGTNVDVFQLVKDSGLEMVQGERAELHGFPEFDPHAIEARMPEFLVGDYPGGAQALVLRKTP